MLAGSPHPLGATFDGEGVNFAVFSANADRIELIFDPQGKRECALYAARMHGRGVARLSA
jgi:glycogen operon protein